jgi:flagellar M-ring protein FliF
VQVVMPERSTVLQAAKRKPSAAVVLQLHPGRELDPEAAQAVVHLVASSIESLDASDVTVVDGSGRLLAPLDDTPGAPGGTLGYQARLEGELADRIESILGKTVGMGRVVARVRADMDWTRNETTEERFDPDSQVARSEQRSTEQSFEGAEGGVPGTASNAPDSTAATGGAAGASGGSSRTTETVNFEISKTVSHRVTPMGRIERLSVAVLVADPLGPDGAATGGSWDEERLLRFESLAKQAVGFSDDRGDQITVTTAPFPAPAGEFEEEGFFGPEWVLFVSNLVRAVAVLLGLVVFGRLIVRPALAMLSREDQPQLPARVSELEAAAAGIGEIPAPPPSLAAQIGQAAALRSEDSVKTVRNWLNQG